MEARGASGIAKALDADSANAIRKNDVLIKGQPSAISMLVWCRLGTSSKLALLLAPVDWPGYLSMDHRFATEGRWLRESDPANAQAETYPN